MPHEFGNYIASTCDRHSIAMDCMSEMHLMKRMAYTMKINSFLKENKFNTQMFQNCLKNCYQGHNEDNDVVSQFQEPTSWVLLITDIILSTTYLPITFNSHMLIYAKLDSVEWNEPFLKL